eukprot:3953705-Amphidinium_carterae.1
MPTPCQKYSGGPAPPPVQVCWSSRQGSGFDLNYSIVTFVTPSYPFTPEKQKAKDYCRQDST